MKIHEDIRFQSLIERMETLLIEGNTSEMCSLLEHLQSLAENEQDDIGLAATYFYKDILKEMQPGDESYMQYAERALRISQAKDIPYYQMKASNSLGITYSELSDFHTSLEYYLQALHVAEAHPEFCYASIVLNNVGNLFVWLEDYDEAVSYLEQAYHKSIEENQDDRQLSALIIANLVELYSNLGNYEKTLEWKNKNYGILDEEEKLTVECMVIITEARWLLQNGQAAAATENLTTFIEKTLDNDDYIYIFRCYINALKLGIQLADFSLCSRLVEKLEQIQDKSTMTSFYYDYATVKVEYYQAFKEQLEHNCHAYYEDYFRQSQNRIGQLRSTYAKSLSVKIALGKAQDENKSVHLQNELLQKDIERDIFTNLYNKVSTEKHVRAAMRERQAGRKQGLMLIDIDLFKRINDIYGHGFGDEVITSVARVLESIEQSPKIAGRFGGDEFLLFLDDQDSEITIQGAAETLLDRVHHIPLPDDRVAQVTLSIGICMIDSNMDFAEAFALADKALYRAKEFGRNHYELSEIMTPVKL